MSLSGWCEHCRDHFDEDHYDEEGNHLVGLEYGPSGVDLLVFRHLMDAEVAHSDESSVLLYVSFPRALWEVISADGT